ncbi:MAG: hypothetical protein MUO39_12155 [Steroidobacteraceae bacterium]|nr:hypothetical protein [Steroidobacteraceae bacterium]
MTRQTGGTEYSSSPTYIAILVALFAMALPGCGGGGGHGSGANPPNPIPPDATAADVKMKEQMLKVMPMLAKAQSGFLFMLNPDAGLTPGVTLIPDLQPGAPANSYTFDGTYDGNDDLISETSISGRVTFGGDPSSLDWSPLTGEATIDVNIPVVGHLYHSTLAFMATETMVQISGVGTFTNPVTGEATTIDVPAGQPVIVRPASKADGVVANACGFNIDGAVPILRSGPTGTLQATWLFSPNTASVAVQQVSFRDPAGLSTAMPDSTVAMTCGSGGTIDDWVADYDQNWVCLPIEHGNARLTLTKTDATTLSVADEDPPGSGDVNTYSVSIVSGSPHAATGFFDAGPVGNTYREHFEWTLGKDGDFSQMSRYAYTEGPNIGSGGICSAIMKRVQ